MYQRLTFGADAIAYIRLKLSTRGMFWRLLTELPLELGKVFAYLPHTAALRDLLYFEWHLHRRKDLENRRVDYEYRERERELILNYTKEPGYRVLVFYGDTAPMGSRIRAREGVVETYHHVLDYTRKNDASPPPMAETHYIMQGALRKEDLDYSIENVAERLPFFCALTSLPDACHLPADKLLSEGVIRELAIRAEGVIVGAYGGNANPYLEQNE